MTELENSFAHSHENFNKFNKSILISTIKHVQSSINQFHHTANQSYQKHLCIYSKKNDNPFSVYRMAYIFSFCTCLQSNCFLFLFRYSRHEFVSRECFLRYTQSGMALSFVLHVLIFCSHVLIIHNFCTFVWFGFCATRHPSPRLLTFLAFWPSIS